MERRLQALVMLFGVLVPLAAWGGQPLGFPTRPIEVVVPFGAGGTSDLLGRTLAELNLRGLSGATVLALVREGQGTVIPTGREHLEAGDVLAVAPTEIIGRFSEPVDPDRSSMELRGPDGSRVARGGVPDGGPLTSMAITGLPPHIVCARGMVRTFQIVQSFANQTVLENIAVGAHLRHARRGDALERARAVAERVGLASQLDKLAASLTIAGRKRLELARALATEPKLLLLDEVLAGLNPHEVAEMLPVIDSIRRGTREAPGVTVFMIEHVMQAVMHLADHVYVLANGKLIAQGAPRDIAHDEAVIEAYLGHGTAERLRAAGRVR